jgi:lysozyme
VQSPISRLGGSTFVMDDGDENGNNELVRIRTRTGHQILLHNSQDLIYIANAPGTAWIEMTSNGKIDIYAADSVSIHSEVDFNFRAERDINLEAGRNINIAAGGNWQVDTTGDFIVNASRNGILSFNSELDIHASGDITAESSTNFHIKSTMLYETASESVHIVAGTNIYQTASTDINIKATGNIVQSAAIISTNSVPAISGTKADSAKIATSLDTQELPSTSVEKGWENLYKGKNISSIMNRVPMHEPWSQHESSNPAQFSPTATDVTVRTGIGTSLRPGVPTTIDYNRAPNVQGTPPQPTNNKAEDNLAAFLWMIRVCEGTSGPNGYRTMWTRATFDPNSPTVVSTNQWDKKFEGQPNNAYQWKDHPNLVIVAPITTNKGTRMVPSTAAGAYQFLYSTWKDCKRALNLPDFSELSQDKAALLLLKRLKVIDLIETGRFTEAIAKTNSIWASLPSVEGATNKADQNPKKFTEALASYKQAGGTFVA